MNNRENTFFDSTIPGDTTISGIKPVSMGSIALLQLIDNPMSSAILNGSEMPVEDTLAMLQFVYIHTHDLNEIASLCLNYKKDSEPFNIKVLEWAMTFDTEKMIEYFSDILRDKDNIKNSKTRIVAKSGEKSESKNEPGQH